jgi:hypothetical protein
MKTLWYICFVLVLVFSLVAICLPSEVLAIVEISPIGATIDFDPDTLNQRSQGKVVTVYIELPEGYSVEDIDISTVLLNGIVPALNHPTAVGDYDNDGIPDLMVKFDRAAVQSILESGDQVEVRVEGYLPDGIFFKGDDTIKVIKQVGEHAAPQLWYLDSEITPAGYQMEKSGGPGDDGQTGSINIGPGISALWLADEAAVCDVTFPSGSWVVEVKTDSDWGTEGDNCEVSVGGWDTDTGWYEIPTITATKITWDAGFNILVILLETNSGTVYQGDYLALKVANEDSSSHEVYTTGSSSVRSPDTDPGYPLPELAAGILLGIGLVGLAGYRWLKKSRSPDMIS